MRGEFLNLETWKAEAWEDWGKKKKHFLLYCWFCNESKLVVYWGSICLCDAAESPVVAQVPFHLQTLYSQSLACVQAANLSDTTPPIVFFFFPFSQIWFPYLSRLSFFLCSPHTIWLWKAAIHGKWTVYYFQQKERGVLCFPADLRVCNILSLRMCRVGTWTILNCKKG